MSPDQQQSSPENPSVEKEVGSEGDEGRRNA